MSETAGDAKGGASATSGGGADGDNGNGDAGDEGRGVRSSSTKEMVTLWDKKVGEAEEDRRKEEEARAVALAKKGDSAL